MERSEMSGSMAEQFLTSWTSDIYRDRCAAQIELVRCEANPKETSDDLVEQFLAQKSSKQLEEFVFEKSKNRDDYLSLVSETLMMLRQHHTTSTVNTQQYDRPSVLEEEVFLEDLADVKADDGQE